MFGPEDQLFEAGGFGMSEEEEQAARERRRQQEQEYRAALPALQGRLYSTLSQDEQALACYYSKTVSFTPDGKGDFFLHIALQAPAGK